MARRKTWLKLVILYLMTRPSLESSPRSSSTERNRGKRRKRHSRSSSRELGGPSMSLFPPMLGNQYNANVKSEQCLHNYSPLLYRVYHINRSTTYTQNPRGQQVPIQNPIGRLADEVQQEFPLRLRRNGRSTRRWIVSKEYRSKDRRC